MPAPSPEELRREFLLDPAVAYLNHGSSGACPRPVFERYQAWQRELESEPVDFLDRRLPALLDTARAALADYLSCSAEDLAFVQNATTGVNLAARSLPLGPGDEVLATDLEYGACDLAWERVCRRACARYVRAPIPLPLRDPSEIVDALFVRASERTRAVYVSHVASMTGLVLPVEEIVARARALGLVTVVDGAHAPAQVPVNIAALGADYYSGNAHKWLTAPKGVGFLHVRRDHQERVTAPSSAGAIEATASPSGSSIRARATPLPGSPSRTRSAPRPSATGTPSANATADSLARPAESSATCWERSRRHRTRWSPRWRRYGSPTPRPTSPSDSSSATASRSPSAAPRTTSCVCPSRPTRRATRSTGS